MSRKVKLVRLLSGEELLTEVVSEQKILLSSSAAQDRDEEVFSKGPVTLKNPLQIVAKDDGNGQVGISFQPWIVFRNRESLVTVRETAVVYVIEADDSLIKQYNAIIDKMTGKSIQTVTGLPSSLLKG